MKKDLQDMVHELTYYIELVIAVIMCGVIAIMTLKLLTTAIPDYIMGDKIQIEGFLEKVMLLAIALEFVKMLCKHTPSTVIDVLLFAIARQIALKHDGLISVESKKGEGTEFKFEFNELILA